MQREWEDDVSESLPDIDRESVERFIADLDEEQAVVVFEERNKGGAPRRNLTSDEKFAIWWSLASGDDLNVLEAKYAARFRTNRAGIIKAIEEYVANLEDHTPELERTLLVAFHKGMVSSMTKKLNECETQLQRYERALEKIDRDVIEAAKTRTDLEQVDLDGDSALRDSLINLAKLESDLMNKSLEICRVRQLEIAAIAKLSAEIAKYSAMLAELTGAKNEANRKIKPGKKGIRSNDNHAPISVSRPSRSPEELRRMIEEARG